MVIRGIKRGYSDLWGDGQTEHTAHAFTLPAHSVSDAAIQILMHKSMLGCMLQLEQKSSTFSYFFSQQVRVRATI